jgi:hypothetical protein
VAINPFSQSWIFVTWRGLRHEFRRAYSTVSRNFDRLKNALFSTPADRKKSHLNQHISTIHFGLYGTRLFVPNQR